MEVRDPDISAIARIFADPARATIVLVLLDGEEHRAGELAARARIAASTASSHLRLLLDAGIVSVKRRGTTRSYVIADERIQRAVQTLAAIAPNAANKNPSLTRSLRIRRLVYARRCFDHIGGAFAMRLVNGLTRLEAVKIADGGFLLRPTAYRVLHNLGVDAVDVLEESPFVRGCEDWTEGGLHFGGPLGAEICSAFLKRDLILANPGHNFLTVGPSAETLISMAIEELAC